MKQLQLDVVAIRGGLAESRHSVHGVVVDADGTVVAGALDPSFVTFWRSCAKPFQVMPLLESGAFDSLAWEGAHLAIACGSHGGEPEHVALVASMLDDVGLEEGDLACGASDPMSARGLRVLRENGAVASRLHNNCSGKHAAMLARATTAGWPCGGYEKVDHEVQKSVVGVVSAWSSVPESDLELAVDGCGVPVFGLPLKAMALAYARLGDAAQKGQEIPARIVGAMREHPHMVAGAERFDTVLIEETGGLVVAKVGAEGVHTLCVPEFGLGAAIKVADGAVRAQYAAVLHLLQLIGVLPATLSARLQYYLRSPVRNTRGAIVGEVRPLGSGSPEMG